MDRREESSRQFVLRAYGVVSILQLFLGVFLFVAGLMALRLAEPFRLHTPPYYTAAFVVAMGIICAGICTLYIYLTEAPLIDFYFLEDSAVKRIRQSVTGNTVSSAITFLFTLAGLFSCVVFALGPCDTDYWPFECSFRTHKSTNIYLAIVITIILAFCAPLTLYSSLMSCIHGWVFDFDVVRIKTRTRSQNSQSDNERPVSGFQQVAMFDIEDHFSEDDELQPSSKYTATSSFKQGPDGRHSGEYDQNNQHDHVRRHNIPQQQKAPNYVAVLNDPAMKQKLLERKSCLQEL